MPRQTPQSKTPPTAPDGSVVGNIVNGVAFTCGATPRKNLADVQVASDVDALVTNNAGVRMMMRYHFFVTSDQNRVFDAGPGGKQLASGAAEHQQYAPFGKVSTQDEFPAKCQFTKVQACPTAIPADWPKAPGGPYYDPFRNGPVTGCQNPVDLEPISLPVPSEPKSCMAVVRGWVNNSLWNQYGDFKRGYWVHGLDKADDALAQATALAQADGFRVGDPNNPPIVDCDHSHGAVVGLRKIGTAQWVVEPFGVWDFIGAAAGNSKKGSEQSAMNSCNAMLTGATMIQMYVNHGITSCELLASW